MGQCQRRPFEDSRCAAVESAEVLIELLAHDTATAIMDDISVTIAKSDRDSISCVCWSG